MVLCSGGVPRIPVNHTCCYPSSLFPGLLAGHIRQSHTCSRSALHRTIQDPKSLPAGFRFHLGSWEALVREPRDRKESLGCPLLGVVPPVRCWAESAPIPAPPGQDYLATSPIRESSSRWVNTVSSLVALTRQCGRNWKHSREKCGGNPAHIAPAVR